MKCPSCRESYVITDQPKLWRCLQCGWYFTCPYLLKGAKQLGEYKLIIRLDEGTITKEVVAPNAATVLANAMNEYGLFSAEEKQRIKVMRVLHLPVRTPHEKSLEI